MDNEDFKVITGMDKDKVDIVFSITHAIYLVNMLIEFGEKASYDEIEDAIEEETIMDFLKKKAHTVNMVENFFGTEKFPGFIKKECRSKINCLLKEATNSRRMLILKKRSNGGLNLLIAYLVDSIDSVYGFFRGYVTKLNKF